MLPVMRSLRMLAGLVGWGGSLCFGGPLLDQLPQNGVQSAFQILRRDYIRRDDLTFEELNRAALQGLLARLDFGASLQPAVQHSVPTDPGVLVEFLAADIAYLRPETFASGEGALFEKALAGVIEKRARHLVLDLRVGTTAGVLDEAASLLQCFLPEGELMFKLKQMGQEDADLYISRKPPLWTGRVVVLIDEDSCPAAETVAACLHARRRAVLIGSKTRGATVRYAEVRLDEATVLRYASAEMLLPDGTSHFRKGLEPHYVMRGGAEDKRKVFSASRGKSMRPYVMDRVRPRFNEAALVAGSNPELDAYVRRSQGQPLPGDEGQLREVVVQRALDLLSGSDLLNAATIRWAEAEFGQEAEATPEIPKAVPAKPSTPDKRP